MLEQFRLLARYNGWINARLYQSAGQLSAAELALDRQAFFGSIIGTLNHIVVGDTVWLSRFATHPARHAALDAIRQARIPSALNEIVFADFASLRQHRLELDQTISQWVAQLSERDLAHILHYQNMQGVAGARNFGTLLLHFFNHQTHHRGQVTTLLMQAGQDVGVTDLLALVPDELTA
ncbi:MAG: DinB family protein [Betaproteobacteria bacterium]|nr:DinB family protein [Betaproteobacteria bacterium]